MTAEEQLNQLPNEGRAAVNDNLEYKIYQFGNYPTIRVPDPKTGTINIKGKNHSWRLKMPAEADWTGGRAGTEDELAAWEEERELEGKKKGKRRKQLNGDVPPSTNEVI